ncbi:MAG: alpha/beta hydrolase [Aeromicrobium sp.]
MTRRNTVLAALVAVVLVGAIVLALVLRGDGQNDAARSGGPANDLERFYEQDLSWSDCNSGKCATVEVPIDYEKPDGETLELRVKLIAAKGEGGRSLFVNPGGPGGAALGFTEYMAQLLPAEVLETYDIIGIDPRGVGESTPVDCVSDRDLDRFIAKDPSPDDASEKSAYRKITADFGAGCRQRSGEIAAHISTEEAARDFDLVREVLGAKTFDWFGYSYGTQLGATYATLFPKRVGRMVLDGATDPSLGTIDVSLGQSGGFDRALTAYIEDCQKRDNCPLAGDADAAEATLVDFLESTDAKALETNEKRKLTEGQAYAGLFYPLYAKELWPRLTDALIAALDGDGTPMLQLSDEYFDRLADGSFAGNLFEGFLAVSCLDSGERGTFDDVEKMIPRFEKGNTVLGRQDAWAAFVCADWPIKATHPQVDIDATGSMPIVVIGTTRDPATPYEWSPALAKQLGTGVLVTREGDGHTAYGSGNTCIDDLVNAYLADGTVPKDDTTCKE